MSRRLAAVTLIAALAAGRAPAAETSARTLSAAELLAEAAATGSVLGPASVDEDVDLARVVAPPDKATVTFRDVRFRGRLSGVPRVPLSVVDGSICAIEAARGDWTQSVDLRGVALGTVRFRDARLRAAWTCLECTVCRAGFQATRFADDATFIRTRFGHNEAAELCRGPAPVCAPSDFAEAIFAGAARFDAASFRTGASFDGADFAQGARFPRVSAGAPVSFIGARFRADAEFRDCRLAGTYFGPGMADAARATAEATEFASRADFRGCSFADAVYFNGAVFAGDALFTRVLVSGGIVSFLGSLGTRTIDLRGLVLARSDAKLLLDATAADAVRLAWDELGPAVLRGRSDLGRQSASMLDALAHATGQHGDANSARKIEFAARSEQRAQQHVCEGQSPGACIASEAEWWFWTFPTRNGSDPTWLFAGLLLLWSGAVVAALRRGRIVVAPWSKAEEDAPSIYDCVPVQQSPAGAYCPVQASARAQAAAAFASGLVFKLGSRRQRWAAPEAPRSCAVATYVLWLAWLLSWMLLALIAKVIITSFPGLEFLKIG
jgi:hypothetical protein